MFQITSRRTQFFAFWFFTERSKADGEEPLELARFRRDCTCDGMTDIHYVKSIRIRSFSGPYFLAFGLNTEWIQKDTEYLSIFSPNAGKCGPEKLLMRALFTHCLFLLKTLFTVQCNCSSCGANDANTVIIRKYQKKVELQGKQKFYKNTFTHWK